MADRSVTLKDLRRRLREMTSTQNDEDLQIEELNDAIANAAAETLDHIITSGLSEQSVLTYDVTPASASFDLSAAPYSKDFYKIFKIYAVENGQYRPIERINLQDIHPYKEVTASIPLRILYIPFASTMKDANGNYDDDTTFDGINGWEEHTLHTAALQVKGKKEEDTSQHERRKAAMEERMAFLGSTDFSGPARVVRKRTARSGMFLPYNNQVTAWTLKNKTITLYYNYPWA